MPQVEAPKGHTPRPLAVPSLRPVRLPILRSAHPEKVFHSHITGNSLDIYGLPCISLRDSWKRSDHRPDAFHSEDSAYPGTGNLNRLSRREPPRRLQKQANLHPSARPTSPFAFP